MPLLDDIVTFFFLIEVSQHFARIKWNKVEFIFLFTDI